MLPSVFLGLDEQEKAFVIAAIKVKLQADEKKAKELKRRGRQGKRGRR